MTAVLLTILTALGVATGNVSSNSYKGGNVFNKEKGQAVEIEQPQPKKALDNITIDLNWSEVANYQDSQDTTKTNVKYYLDGRLTNNVAIGSLYSSSYSVQIDNSNNGQVFAENTTFIHITPYRNTINNSLTFETKYAMAAASNENLHISVWQYVTTQDLDSYIDLTTYNAKEIYEELLTELDQTKIITTNYNGDNQVSNFWNWIYYNQTITIQSITEDLWVYMYAVVYNITSSSQAKSIHIAPSEFTWQGQYLQENYEVVDIPNLMFTILTLPFAWYSTAFNLTIFPGTPYSLNFGNLVLTIVAAMILMYLIKKVIK